MTRTVEKRKGSPHIPNAISVELTGCVTRASRVPVSCSSRTLFATPTLAAWTTTVRAMPTRAKAK